MADKQNVYSHIDERSRGIVAEVERRLARLKAELMNEMKYSSVQMGALYQEMKNDKDRSSQAISQEIRYSYKQNQTIYDGITEMITTEVGARINEMDEKVASLAEVKTVVAEVVEKLNTLEEMLNESKYTYLQQQAIYDGLSALISGDVVSKLDDVVARVEALEQIEKAVSDIITMIEENDYKAVIESVAEKTEESVAVHSRQILDAVAAIPVAENVDYNRIVDEVGDKVIELLGEVITEDAEPTPTQPVEAKIDYDRIIYGAAEKVVESLPYPEKVDYRRINDSFEKSVEKLQPTVSDDVIANAVALAVEKAMAAIDIDAIASAVAERIEIPVVEPETIDYDRLADMVAARITASAAEQVAEVVVDESGLEKIAEKVAEKLAVVDETEDSEEEVSYNLVLDEEGIQAVAKGVAEELCRNCAECAPCATEETVEETVEEVVEETIEEPVEEVIEEVVEETVEPVVEEVVEETVEEVVEETVEEVAQPVEETVVEETASEELAVAAEPVEHAEPAFDELNDQLVDAETGLVIRLKKSFTAKMKQSDERVKGYYSDLKNELTSYKKINSNVSWHGDRFNYGRDTIAKVNICGKTLCFYVALDPEDPELKTTVYHQKNVGNQKAYESTPFMVKIKSDAAAKKALRLVGYLAEKLGAEKEADFENVDYVEEFAYASTKQLFDEGFIKVTKEKKVDLDF